MSNPPHRRSLEVGLADANTAFTALFCLELVLKVVGLGPWTYLSDYWNLFDALVVSFRCAARRGRAGQCVSMACAAVNLARPKRFPQPAGAGPHLREWPLGA
jgi:hypothetical protein